MYSVFLLLSPHHPRGKFIPCLSVSYCILCRVVFPLVLYCLPVMGCILLSYPVCLSCSVYSCLSYPVCLSCSVSSCPNLSGVCCCILLSYPVCLSFGVQYLHVMSVCLSAAISSGSILSSTTSSSSILQYLLVSMLLYPLVLSCLFVVFYIQ